MRKPVSAIMFMVLLISMLGVTFNVLPVEADTSFHLPEKDGEIVRVVEHTITVVELEELKREVGVWERHTDYNKIINGYGTGLRPPIENEWHGIAEHAYMVERVEWSNPTTSSPSYVDHTSSSWFPPIGDQDVEGSCTTWTVGYYMKTFQEAKEHGWNLSAAAWEGGYKGHPTPAYQGMIFSPDFIYHQINGGGDNGSYFSDAMNLVSSIGACSWEEMPYDPDNSTSWPSEEAWREAPLYRGNSTGIEYMDLETDADIASLKNWIASDHLAAIGVDAYQYNDLTSDDVWTLDKYLDPIVNHANTVVGYDDDLEYVEGGVTRYGAFKVANSWGIGGWENVDDGCYWISYEAMKHRVGYCMFYRDRIGYDPKLVASFRIDHPKRGECNITFGIGNKSAPVQTKRFDDWRLDGGNHPFCSNNMVLDLTEFKDAVPAVINQSFFIKVYDGDGSTTGTILSFSIEYYYNYSSGTLHAKSTYRDAPVSTINYHDVFAELVLNTTWTVDDDGPADFHTIQEAINAANPGDTIYVYNGTYYEHLTVDKSLMLVGEDPSTTIIDGSGSGTIVAMVTDGISVSGFKVQNGYRGIELYSSSWNTIKNNIVDSNSNIGIYISWYSVRNNLIANTVTSSGYIGVNLMYSPNNILRGNNMSNNEYNLAVEGSSLLDYTNDIDTSNTVDGKPVYYLIDQHNLTVDPTTFPNIGYLALINSENITVRGLNLTKNGSGVLFADVTDSIIENINASNNIYGISLESSSDNSILRNTIVNNRFYGICLWGNSSENGITGNYISRNSVGIRGGGEGNRFTCNNISYSHGKYVVNGAGIQLYFSTNNEISHNNFINNSMQAYTRESPINAWDDGYPSGGNYWSDYNGTDLFSGTYQNITGSDGIGDTPYGIDENNTDRYPLMTRYPCIHAVAVKDVRPGKTVLGQGFTTKIHVDIANQGHFIETFNLTVYANTTMINTFTNITLSSVSSTTVTFTWNTTGVAKGNYTIKAKATPVLGETDTADNTNYADKEVCVTFPGDVNGDGKVRIDDVLAIALAFGSEPGHPRWDPSCDINGDLEVRVDDIFIATMNFGKKVP